MSTRGIRAGLAALAGIPLCLTLLVVLSWARGVVPPPPVATRDGQTVRRSEDSVAPPALGALVAHDPFRARRAPAPIAYDPATLAGGPLPPAPLKPVLTLTGIAWGEEPEAVIEGFPTTDGPRVVRAGETVGGLKIKRITPDHVVITGMDTTWTLKVREPWR